MFDNPRAMNFGEIPIGTIFSWVEDDYWLEYIKVDDVSYMFKDGKYVRFIAHEMNNERVWIEGKPDPLGYPSGWKQHE